MKASILKSFVVAIVLAASLAACTTYSSAGEDRADAYYNEH